MQNTWNVESSAWGSASGVAATLAARGIPAKRSPYQSAAESLSHGANPQAPISVSFPVSIQAVKQQTMPGKKKPISDDPSTLCQNRSFLRTHILSSNDLAVRQRLLKRDDFLVGDVGGVQVGDM